MATVILNRFDGSIVNDPRFPNEAVSRYTGNADILTDPHRMNPYRASEDGHDNQSTEKLQNFCIAKKDASTYALFGLGVVSGGSLAQIQFKNLTTGSSNDLDDNTWVKGGNNASSSGAVNTNLFVYYQKTGYLYGARAGSHIWRADPTGAGAWVDSHQAISYTNISQGLVHSKDDILYIPYDNKIAKNNNGSWTTDAIVLPSHLYITSISEYGNYIAIGCAQLSGIGNSIVFLWDRDTSLTTLSDSIDWGEGNLKVLEEVDGALIGISLSGSNSTRLSDRVIFRVLLGSQAVKFGELIGSTSTQLPITKQKINNRLHFMLSLVINGSTREGVWSVGRSSPNAAFTIVHERTPNNDTAVTNSVLRGFFYVGDYVFIAYVDNSVETLSKTNDSTAYVSGIRETVKNPGMDSKDRARSKQLVAVLVNYESIPSSGQVKLEYRVDSESTWTEVFTDTTVGSVSSLRTKAGNTQFTKGREYEFRLTFKGSAVFSVMYRYDVLETTI